MDLLNTVSNISFSDAQGGFAESLSIGADFAKVCEDVLNDGTELADILPILIDLYGDEDDWEAPSYLNFKDILITPKGIRGLTNGFWSWGIAFTYSCEDGLLHIDDRLNGSGNYDIEIPASAKRSFENIIDEYILGDYPNGLFASIDGIIKL